MKMFGISWKSCTITCHCSPGSDRKQFTFLILGHQIFQDRGIIDKCVQCSGIKMDPINLDLHMYSTNIFSIWGLSINDDTHLGGGWSAKRRHYSISLFSKMGDIGEEGVKNLKKWVTSFMDSSLKATIWWWKLKCIGGTLIFQ